MNSFQHIGVIVKKKDDRIRDTVTALLTKLRNLKLDIHLDQTLATLSFAEEELISREKIGQLSDLVMVVGGDGTLLDAARTLADHGNPLLGVNVGRLGFLVDVYPNEMSTRLESILGGDYQIESRSMLQGHIERDDEVLARGVALNDIVIHSDEAIRMIEFETCINGQLMNFQRADGMIVSTSTGSTAYALSGGGPILQPGINAVALVPICPHTLSSRPIVINSDSRITICLSPQSRTHARVAFDGHENIKIQPMDTVVIEPYPHKIRIIHPIDHDYYAILREKLRWSEQP